MSVMILGDSTNELQSVVDESVHLTFTSPPYYNAREYSQYRNYEEYLNVLKAIFFQVHRVMVEGRFLVVNTSPTIEPRAKRSQQSKRYAIPFDLHNILIKIGWEFIDDIIWLKPDGAARNRNGGFFQHRKPLGYKPNIITEYITVYRKRTDRLIDWNMRKYSVDIIEKSKVEDGYEITNVWRIPPKADKLHPAVFPLALAERIVAYYSYVNDIVLDPFAGSGTVGAAAVKLGRKFIGIEKDPGYFDIAKKRIEGVNQ